MPAFRRVLGQISVQVLIAVAVGAAVGALFPQFAAALKPVADGFIKLIRMLLGPIVFGTIVVGIARSGDLKSLGRIGLKSLIYFEALSTLALVIGLVVVNVVKPGAGMNVNAAAIDGSAVAGFTAAAREQGMIGFLLDIVPTTVVDAFAKGVMLQIILLSVLTGCAMSSLGERSRPLLDFIDLSLQVLFKIVGMVMRLAPLGAGAGIAFTIGRYGLGTLWSLAYLLLALYVTSALFVFAVLAPIVRLTGLPFLPFLRFIGEEIFIVFGTCSTEAVLPRLMQKLEDLGCARPVVGLVLPAGYTFNADGTCIYLSLAAVFVAQATNTPLGITDQIVILAVLMLASKGSAGLAGAGFVTLAATLTAIPAIPLNGLVLLLGADRFLNEARAVTNLIGNSVATVAIARWEGALDLQQARTLLEQQRLHRSAAVEMPAAQDNERTF
jgi:aerobic C4-dicarboxylate transport protein